MGPLSGLKVLDASEGIAGPFCAKLFADYGANVIKIEPPSGDFIRRTGPMQHPSIEASGTYLYLNSNKRGVTLDLSQPTAKDPFLRLIQWADVIVESMPPGFLVGLGLGFADLTVTNRTLVMVSVTSFGQHGPYRNYRANEMVLCALGGLFIITGEPDREPISISLPRVQFLAGLYAYEAGLASLFGLEAQDRGVHIDVPIVNSVVSCLQNATTVSSYSGYEWERVGNFRPGAYPITVFPCADGYVTLAAHDEIRWKALCKLIDRPDLLDDPRFRKSPLRAANRKDLDEYLAPWFRDKKKFDVFELGQRHGVGMGIVATPEDILQLPQHRARDFFTEVDQPGVGRLQYPGVPFKLPGLADARRPAPALGQHNTDIYRDLLGYSDEDVERFFCNGII
jgi:crotonobetainyl-CoA:carnitine CoA-transferase CaiB-like acyl-CoA transferase